MDKDKAASLDKSMSEKDLFGDLPCCAATKDSFERGAVDRQTRFEKARGATKQMDCKVELASLEFLHLSFLVTMLVEEVRQI